MNSDMGHGDKGSDKTCNDHENESLKRKPSSRKNRQRHLRSI